MIRLNVFIQVSAENRTAVLESAKELVAYSLKDNGCIAYDVFESATRSDVLMDSNPFLFKKDWSSTINFNRNA